MSAASASSSSSSSSAIQPPIALSHTVTVTFKKQPPLSRLERERIRAFLLTDFDPSSVNIEDLSRQISTSITKPSENKQQQHKAKK